MSGASKKTYEYQGGKLSKKEVENFEKNKLFKYHLIVRKYDDMAKSTEKKLLDKIKNMNHLSYYSKFIDH